MSCRGKCTKRGDRTTFVVVYMQSLTPTARDDGQIVETDNGNTVKVGEWWGSVLPKRGRERPIGDQMQGSVTHIAVIPYDLNSKTIGPDMWLIKPDGTRLNVIRSYDPRQDEREIEMELTEKVTTWTPGA